MTLNSSSLLGDAATTASNASAWGDLNQDGYLDVYILQDVSDVLLQAQTNGNGSFAGYSDITSTAGLYTETDLTSAAMWADLDDDGDQDLFVTWGGPEGQTGQDPEWSYYYLNTGPNAQGDFVFDDVTGELSGAGIGELGLVQAVDFADLNGDDFLDVILAYQVPGATGGLSNLLIYLNDGSGGLRVELGAASSIFTVKEIADVEVTDLDGNGVLDVIGIPADGSTPLVYLGHGDASNRAYWDGSIAAGLGSGSTFGVTVADFNRDTDPDIFLLRPETGPNPQDKAFMWANPRLTAPPVPGSERFLNVTFNDLPNGANRMGLGARVTVVVNEPTGEVLRSTQVVDGGSGHGSQGSGRLVFGLGSAGTAAMEVVWPHGGRQIYPDVSAIPGFPDVEVTFVQDPLIDTASITSTYTPSSGSMTTHKFKWWTQYAGGDPEVLLTIASPATTDCKSILGGGTQLLLKAGVSGVSVASVPSNGGFEHRVNLSVQCFGGCNYNYTVRNVVGGSIYSDGIHLHQVSVCGGFGM